jgi:uncharacterized protein YyaL (SSP411 family)
MLDLFWDNSNGGLFLSPKDGESLLIRPKEIYDGALPSGNSIALHNLLHLQRLTGNPELGHKAKLLIRAFSGTLLETPSGYTQFLASLYRTLSPTVEVVIAGTPGESDTRKMLAVMRNDFLPQVVTVFKKSPADIDARLAHLAPYTADHIAIDGKATAYVCRNNSCAPPTTDPLRLEYLLQNHKPDQNV